jgi:hypothetical protein
MSKAKYVHYDEILDTHANNIAAINRNPKSTVGDLAKEHERHRKAVTKALRLACKEFVAELQKAAKIILKNPTMTAIPNALYILKEEMNADITQAYRLSSEPNGLSREERNLVANLDYGNAKSCAGGIVDSITEGVFALAFYPPNVKRNLARLTEAWTLFAETPLEANGILNKKAVKLIRKISLGV